jgi:hypothetical protein
MDYGSGYTLGQLLMGLPAFVLVFWLAVKFRVVALVIKLAFVLGWAAATIGMAAWAMYAAPVVGVANQLGFLLGALALAGSFFLFEGPALLRATLSEIGRHWTITR